LTSSYEFDGASLKCWRFPSRLVWTEPLDDLVSAHRYWGRFTDSIRLEWCDRKRFTLICSTLDKAIADQQIRSATTLVDTAASVPQHGATAGSGNSSYLLWFEPG
jgi:hypothetical protein